MKQRYSITIAGTEMNVITDEAPEFVDEVVLPGGDMDIFGHINEIAKYMEN